MIVRFCAEEVIAVDYRDASWIPASRNFRDADDETVGPDSWWMLYGDPWPTLGPSCRSNDPSVQLTFRLLDRD